MAEVKPEDVRRVKAIAAAQWMTPEDEAFMSALIAAGWTPSALRAAGWTPSALIAAGWTPSALIAAGSEFKVLFDLEKLPPIPRIDKPYTKMLADIKAKLRCHDQSTFGPADFDPNRNLCRTRMCTAGHLVNMAGEPGYKLLKALNGSFEWAAMLIHSESCPNVAPQNFGGISQEMAMAYIEQRAAEEAAAS